MALPSLAIDLRDASAGAGTPTGTTRVLRSVRVLRAGHRDEGVVRVAGIVDDARGSVAPGGDEEGEDGLPVKSLRSEAAADGESPPRTGSRARPTERGSAERERSAGERDRGAAERERDRGASRRDAARKDPCAESAKACRQALDFLRDDDIASIDLDIRVGGKPGNDYPCECLLEGETFQPRRFASTTMTWKAAGYCHKPLYFEDWELERYGHSRGMFLDPFIAGAHFFVTLPILPYKVGMQAPWECVYPLGYYRPGSCAPWTVPAVPYSARGFAVQGATVTGLVFLLP